MNLIFTSLLLFFLVPLSLANTHIENACKSISRADSSIPYNFCVTSLIAIEALDPSNPPSDYQTLAEIAIWSAHSFARDISSRISELTDIYIGGWAKDEEDVRRSNEIWEKENRYKKCYVTYMEARKELEEALTNVSKRRYGKAKKLVRAASGAYEKCLNFYKGTGHVNQIPVTWKERVDFDTALKIAAAILSMKHS